MEKKDIIQSFKDSLFTGFIALALFGPIVGLRTASKGEGLFITPQWGVVFLLVGPVSYTHLTLPTILLV